VIDCDGLAVPGPTLAGVKPRGTRAADSAWGKRRKLFSHPALHRINPTFPARICWGCLGFS